MRMTLAQYLLKHNCRIAHHDRLFYGKYLYSQRIFLPISRRQRYMWALDSTTTIIDDENPMGDWILTNRAIADLKKDAKQNQRDVPTVCAMIWNRPHGEVRPAIGTLRYSPLVTPH